MTVDKPSIVSVIGDYISLRKSGTEWIGLCPFHSDRIPSFSVNEQKGLFYCFGCGAGGDAIRFIEVIEGISFLEALALLGIRRDQIPRSQNDAVKRLAATVSAWTNGRFDKAQNLLREIGQRESLARELNWQTEVEHCNREWEILSVLSDDLQDPTRVMELWTEREAVEAMLADAIPEPLPDFPPITDEYRGHLKAVVRGEL